MAVHPAITGTGLSRCRSLPQSAGLAAPPVPTAGQIPARQPSRKTDGDQQWEPDLFSHHDLDTPPFTPKPKNVAMA